MEVDIRISLSHIFLENSVYRMKAKDQVSFSAIGRLNRTYYLHLIISIPISNYTPRSTSISTTQLKLDWAGSTLTIQFSTLRTWGWLHLYFTMSSARILTWTINFKIKLLSSRKNFNYLQHEITFFSWLFLITLT